MKFEFIKSVSGAVPGYGGQSVTTGDIVELNGHLAGKAKGNPDYRVVTEATGEDSLEVADLTTKRRGRPPKAKDGDEG